MERSLYCNACKSSRETLKAAFTEADLFQPPPPLSYSPPKRHQITVHYSFDMAQQVNEENVVHIGVLSFTTNRSTIPVTRFSLAQYTF